MKKYNQLLLLIISVVSLSLFLIYRHEYNRLHYVLEVFNFFGQPCNVSDLQQTENILSHHDWGPTPVWQEHEGSYIYSAFLTEQNEAKALALCESDKLVPRNCYMWFEDKKKPTISKFKYSKIGDNVCFYTCMLQQQQHDQTPFAVSFSHKTKKESELKKIMLVNSNNRQININTTICVSPSVYSKRRLIEFISYHKLIGIGSFIFYNKDVPHRVAKLITNLSTRLNLQAAFLPWNYPRNEGPQTRVLIENDCLLRTSAQSLYAITLEINEYIVPTHVFNFNMLMKDFNNNKFGKLSLPVQKFCIGNVEGTKPISMQNVAASDDSMAVRFIHKNGNNGKENSDILTYAVERGHASIHKYIKCTTEPTKTHSDTSILKFSTDLSRSTLFQLLLHDQI